MGVFCAYQIIAIYKAASYVSEKNVGLMTAVANMVIMVFGYAFHGLIGYIISYVDGGGSEINHYSASSFQWGVAIIPAALMFSALGFMILIIREKQDEIFGVTKNRKMILR